MSTHYLGEHSKVTKERLEELATEFGAWIYEAMNNGGPTFCECELINKCVAVGKTPEEIAVLAYISGKTMTEVGVLRAMESISIQKGSSIKN